MNIFNQICGEQIKINEVLRYIEKEYYCSSDESILNKVAIASWKNKGNCIGNVAAKVMMG